METTAEMEAPPVIHNSAAAATAINEQQKLTHHEEKRHRSIFEVLPNFFDSCRLLESRSSTASDPFSISPSKAPANDEDDYGGGEEEERDAMRSFVRRWSCNTCKAGFESLQDQRAHFKSDFHRLNIKLSIAGKDTLKEEDFDESTSDSLFRDYDISSISGSEDEDDKESGVHGDANKGASGSVKSKIFIQLQSGERISIWKCLLASEFQKVSFDNGNSFSVEDDSVPYLTEKEVAGKLRYVIQEPRNNTHLRAVLLSRGGHFAGCVFDGNSIVAHKTFHRYVIRAKAGKKQSSKDATGKTAHSAGASMRRHNELALKKEIRELLTAWKPYFDSATCVFIHAPSNNRQLLFDGEKPCFSCPQHFGIRNIPLTVRRPTLKEAKRIYSILTQVLFEADEEISTALPSESSPGLDKENLGKNVITESSDVKKLESASLSSDDTEPICTLTPLHDASKSGNYEKVLELLEQGLDPCIKDERGRTPYMVATEKEVRNTFRRFMASNLDKWDWQAAKVPSPLTKDMEELQNARQAEKDAKRKARAKELKKLRKAREKKSQAEAAQSQDGPSASNSDFKAQSSTEPISKEEELRRARDADREKRATAAEQRIAALRPPIPASSENISCSCCRVSLAGKVPFHRYDYKYCSVSCMHVHGEILEDG